MSGTNRDYKFSKSLGVAGVALAIAFASAALAEKALKMMRHDHGAKPAAKVHADEVGHCRAKVKVPHKHAPGAPKHQD